MAGLKRRNTGPQGTRVGMKRIRRTAQGQQGEYKRTKVAAGRSKMISFRTFMNKILSHRYLRYQRCNKMALATNTFPGQLVLDNNVVGTGQRRCPLFAFCLNSTVNNNAGNTPVAYQLRYTNATISGGGANMNSSIAWENVGNADPTNPNATAANPEWFNEYNSSTTGDNHRFIRQNWYDIRLMCYGANNQPTRYCIQVVRFDSGHLSPTSDGNDGTEVADRTSFWAGMVQPFMNNPILPSVSSNRLRGKMKVVKTVDFIIDPGVNIDNDTLPTRKEVRMYIRDGKVYDYRYSTSTLRDFDDIDTCEYVANQATTSAIPNAFEVRELPKPRAQMWLIVRAMNTTSTAQTVANTPSFDVIIRKKESFFD